MIEPGIGRIVHFRHEGAAPGELPHAAMIIGIRDSRCVNLACFSPAGTYYSRLDVPLLQNDDAAPEASGYAEWMAFQKGQAVKTEAAESSLHPRIAALEQLLTGGGHFHTMIEDLKTGVESKFTELGDWLTKRLADIDQKVAHPLIAAVSLAPATPDTPQPNPAAQGATAANPEPPAAAIAAQPDANAAATAEPQT